MAIDVDFRLRVISFFHFADGKVDVVASKFIDNSWNTAEITVVQSRVEGSLSYLQ